MRLGRADGYWGAADDTVPVRRRSALVAGAAVVLILAFILVAAVMQPHAGRAASAGTVPTTLVVPLTAPESSTPVSPASALPRAPQTSVTMTGHGSTHATGSVTVPVTVPTTPGSAPSAPVQSATTYPAPAQTTTSTAPVPTTNPADYCRYAASLQAQLTQMGEMIQTEPDASAPSGYTFTPAGRKLILNPANLSQYKTDAVLTTTALDRTPGQLPASLAPVATKLRTSMDRALPILERSTPATFEQTFFELAPFIAPLSDTYAQTLQSVCGTPTVND